MPGSIVYMIKISYIIFTQNLQQKPCLASLETLMLIKAPQGDYWKHRKIPGTENSEAT